MYMDLPPGFIDDLHVGKVWKLEKSLNELKQSPKVWFGRFTKVLKKVRVLSRTFRSYYVL